MESGEVSPTLLFWHIEIDASYNGVVPSPTPGALPMSADFIRVRGRRYTVQEQLHLGRRDFLVIKKLSSGLRERYQAYDTVAKDFRCLIVIPNSPRTIGQVHALRRLSQRNAINFPMILDSHPRGDQLFIVQAWISGRDLAAKIRHAEEKSAWPSPQEAFQIFRRLVHGVSQLHKDTGLIHGDIKPANLVLDRSRVFLVDFGNAWSFEQPALRSPGDGLSGAYTAPEQHRSESFLDPRVDQFSASVIAYQLLTGRLPYDGMGGKAGRAEFVAEFADTLIAPSQLSPHVKLLSPRLWSQIDWLVLRGLAISPDERFPTTASWLEQIEAIHLELQNRTRLSTTNLRWLNTLEWVASLFRKAKSTL